MRSGQGPFWRAWLIRRPLLRPAPCSPTSLPRGYLDPSNALQNGLRPQQHRVALCSSSHGETVNTNWNFFSISNTDSNVLVFFFFFLGWYRMGTFQTTLSCPEEGVSLAQSNLDTAGQAQAPSLGSRKSITLGRGCCRKSGRTHMSSWGIRQVRDHS